MIEIKIDSDTGSNQLIDEEGMFEQVFVSNHILLNNLEKLFSLEINM